MATFNQRSFWVVGLLSLLLSGFIVHSRPFLAEPSYRAAETAQFELESFDRISNQLGFGLLSQYEDSKLRALLQRALVAYFKVLKAEDPIWSSRAAYRIAELVAQFYRKQVFDYLPGYRHLKLPSPFLIRSQSAHQKGLNKKLDALQNEITLLYETITTYANRLNKDKELLNDLQEKLESIQKAALRPQESIISPFSGGLAVGTLWDTKGQIKRLQRNGRWQSVAPSNWKAIQDAIKDPTPSIRLSGLITAELHPNAQLLPSLLAHWKRVSTLKSPALFSNLQNTLFGERERVLLSLKALVKKDQKSLAIIFASPELPSAEKAWLLGFAPKNEITTHMAKELLKEEDALTASRALWVLYQINSRIALPLARQLAADRRLAVRLVSLRILEKKSNQT